MADAVAIVLLIEVGLSALTLAIGLVLFVVTGETGYQEVVTRQMLQLRPSPVYYPHNFGDVVRGAIELRPFAIIQLGVVFLIATPVLRVAASVLLFALEDDALYTGITLAVLALLLFSIFIVG